MENPLALVAVYGVLLLVLLALRMWIGLALALVGFVGLVLFRDPEVAGKVMVGRVHDGLFSFVLTAIPLFVMMAEIISRGGGGRALYNAIGPIAERFLPGGLIHANIVSCAMFGAVCGSVLGGAAAMGSVAIPQLRERGYNVPFAAGSIAAAGPLAVIIPPSLGFILFGSVTGVSIASLFIGGIIPGIVLAALMMLAAFVMIRLRPGLVPSRRSKERLGLAAYTVVLLKIVPISLLAGFILYVIYGGICTPTEAAGIGVAAAIIMGLAARQLTWRRFVEAIEATIRTTGTIFFIYAGAIVFSISLSTVGFYTFLRETFLVLPTGPIGTTLIIMVVYIFTGMFIDGVSMLLIFTPITFPILLGFGFDPIHIGVLLVLFCEIGCMTPPVGLTLFVMQGISGEDTLSIARGAVPFTIATIVGAVIMIFFPILPTWLPSRMG